MVLTAGKIAELVQFTFAGYHGFFYSIGLWVFIPTGILGIGVNSGEVLFAFG